MDRARLNRLRRRLAAMRDSPCKPREVESLAEQLGRYRANRGKEPTWISGPFPHLRPVSIPHHSGDLAKGTTGIILDNLERADLAAWDAFLDPSEE
jgi:hypothetical protein